MEHAQAGFTNILNMDYEDARRTFASLGREFPHHPAPPLYLASIIWLEEMLRRQDLSLNRFITPTYFSRKTDFVMPPHARAEFFNNLQKCQDLAKGILLRNPRDMDARYFLATSYGLRSSYAITIDHSLREAFSNGNRAYASMKKLIEENPKYYDAYLTVGLYEYIVGGIPWYLKWIAFVIGAHGSKQEGMEHLRLASEKGQYVRNEAQLVLMVLNVRERRYAEALEIARTLSSRYPRSFLFSLNTAQILRMSRQKEEALAMLLQVEKRIEAKEPNFDRLLPQSFRYNFGVELMAMGQLDIAEDRFRKIISDPQTQMREKILSHLCLARLLDRKGQKNEAAGECEIVLSLKDIESSHTQARQLLEKISND
jgi:tetratricopeptide (TPR) repeat protein